MTDWTLKIEAVSAVVDKVPSLVDHSRLRNTIEVRAKDLGLKWFLGHSDRGVIWGHFENDKLLIAAEAADVKDSASPFVHFDPLTLQQARCFSEQAEVMFWRNSETDFFYRTIWETDSSAPTWNQYYDEDYYLWGTDCHHEYNGKPLNGFTLLTDGTEGLAHVPPLSINGYGYQPHERPVRLRVRNYISSTGFARIEATRLVTLYGDVK